MKNGKVQILYTTPLGFLMALWRNLFKDQKDLEVLKMRFVVLQKEEHLGWVYLDGTRISKKMECLLKVYLLSLKLGKYFRKLKLKVKELPEILLKFMASLCGVLVLACAILTFALLLPLYLIVSFRVMYLRVLSRGRQTYSQSNLLKERL